MFILICLIICWLLRLVCFIYMWILYEICTVGYVALEKLMNLNRNMRFLTESRDMCQDKCLFLYIFIPSNKNVKYCANVAHEFNVCYRCLFYFQKKYSAKNKTKNKLDIETSTVQISYLFCKRKNSFISISWSIIFYFL